MKKLINSALFLVLLLSFTSIFAGGFKTKHKNPLKNTLENQIFYPELAENQQIEGVVLVDLFVNKNGKLEINNISASSLVFKNHIETKIQQLNQNNDYSKLIGQNYLYKFHFNVEK